MENPVYCVLHLNVNDYIALRKRTVYLLGENKAPNDPLEVDDITCATSDASFDEEYCLLEITENGEVYIIDLLSRNGIFVSGQRIQPMERCKINMSVPIMIGGKSVELIPIVSEINITGLSTMFDDNPSSSKTLNLTISKINSNAFNESIRSVTIKLEYNNGGSSAVVLGATEPIDQSDTSDICDSVDILGTLPNNNWKSNIVENGQLEEGKLKIKEVVEPWNFACYNTDQNNFAGNNIQMDNINGAITNGFGGDHGNNTDADESFINIDSLEGFLNYNGFGNETTEENNP